MLSSTLQPFEQGLEQKLMYMYQHDIQQSYDDEGMIVTQHLSPEQYAYEFPTKAWLKSLDYLDFDNHNSFFDPFSFHEALPDHMYEEGAYDSVPIMDTDDSSSGSSSSIRTTDSRIVLIKLNKSQLTYVASDEGYEESRELASECVFYPIYDARHQAATKIQAVWRGYRARRDGQNPNRMAQLLAMWSQVERRRQGRFQDRLEQMERELREERAMRVAFEKAMEDMTELIDRQQKSLFDRLVEQEREMQRRHEVLEAKVRKEVQAKLKLEGMMSRVLDQLHISETQREAKEEEVCRITRTLEKVVDDVSLLKKKNKLTSTTAAVVNDHQILTSSVVKKKSTVTHPQTSRRPFPPTTTSRMNQPTSVTNQLVKPILPQSKSRILERPSVVPSNRRLPNTTTKQRTLVTLSSRK
ncbi:MAG: hypothetical protein EXX96DRAFT_609418 [Benjaminiella poitrasii]|nr:MAG: hypothetical protein EXX96DRAFT_609418 [Benjaminiella poitrasii]